MNKQNTIAIAADHAGINLKTFLKNTLENNGYSILDLGCHNENAVDYPDFANKIATAIKKQQCLYGILICGSGIGMSIAANRNSHIRAALCHNSQAAELARQHNDANIIILAARQIQNNDALTIVTQFLTTQFSGDERHKRRIQKISNNTNPY